MSNEYWASGPTGWGNTHIPKLTMNELQDEFYKDMYIKRLEDEYWARYINDYESLNIYKTVWETPVAINPLQPIIFDTERTHTPLAAAQATPIQVTGVTPTLAMPAVPAATPPTTEPVAISVTDAEIEKYLNPTLFYFVKNHPDKPDLRGLILQKTQMWVPEEEKNILEYMRGKLLETKVKAHELQLAKLAAKNATNPTNNPVPIPAVPPITTILPANQPATHQFRLRYSEQEIGTCRFYQNNDYRGQYRLPNEVLQEIIYENNGNLDTVFESVKEYIEEQDINIDLYSEGDYEYDDYNTNEYNDRQYNWDDLYNYLDEYLNPEPEEEPEPEDDFDERFEPDNEGP